MTTTITAKPVLEPQAVPPANEGHVSPLTADERLLRQAVARCLKAQVAEVHGRLVGGGAVKKGGPGSGNFSHEGRPGEVGGSGPGGGDSSVPNSVISQLKSGEPAELTLYHGTRMNFDEFDSSLANANTPGLVGNMILFTDRKDEAEFYTKKTDNDYNERVGDSPQLLTSKVQMENPLVVSVKENPTNYYDTHEKELLGDFDDGSHDAIIIRGVLDDGSASIVVSIPDGSQVEILSREQKSLKSRSPTTAIPSSTKPWDDMVMHEVRPIWFGLFKKGGDRALTEIRKFPKHARKMAVLSWAEMEASERVEVVTKGGEGSGNFGHSGRPGEVGGSGEGFAGIHGTSTEFVDSILKEGISLNKASMNTPWEGITKEGYSFLADEPAMALSYAKYTAFKGNKLPVLIAVTIPKESAHLVERDPTTHSAFQYKGDIKPEWITDVWIAKVFGEDPFHPGWMAVGEPKTHPQNWSKVKSFDTKDDSISFYIVLLKNIKEAKSLKSTPSIVIPEWIEDPEVLDALEREMFKFAHGINQTTADDLRAELMAGMENGETISQLADRISGLSDEWVEGWRSEMIARTETARAFSTGHIEAWKSTGVVSRKVWVAAGDACPFCQAMNGTAVELDENFVEQGDDAEAEWRGETILMKEDYSDVNGPPLHPNCRCTIVAELSETET